jgi:hypothetical protein
VEQEEKYGEYDPEEDDGVGDDGVDFMALGQSSHSARQTCLFAAMPVPEISRLVGWATSHHSNDTPHTMLDPHYETENPLLHLHTSGASCLPPSFLAHVSIAAGQKLQNTAQILQDQRKKRKLEADKRERLLKKASKTKKGVVKHPTDPSSKASTITAPATTNEEQATKSPKAVVEETLSLDDLYETMDFTALMGTGVAWEEVMTAHLLPLARAHVARCRRLEQRNHHGTAFHEWTLPPAEAIVQLAREAIENNHSPIISNNPTTSNTSPATPSTSPNDSINHEIEPQNETSPAVETNDDSIGKNIDDKDDNSPLSLSTTRLCNHHGVDSNLVKNNMELFQHLL